MLDGKNKQEFQMGQLEEKHDQDGHGKASDSHLTGSPMPSPVNPNPLSVQALVQSNIPWRSSSLPG